MVLFLRNKKNETILDCDVYQKEDVETDRQYIELSSTVCIEPYSLLLLSLPTLAERVECMKDFGYLQELRGWLWEVYFVGRKNDAKEYDEVLEALIDG